MTDTTSADIDIVKEREAFIKWFDIDNVETGKTAREAIINAMKDEK